MSLTQTRGKKMTSSRFTEFDHRNDPGGHLFRLGRGGGNINSAQEVCVNPYLHKGGALRLFQSFPLSLKDFIYNRGDRRKPV